MNTTRALRFATVLTLVALTIPSAPSQAGPTPPPSLENVTPGPAAKPPAVRVAPESASERIAALEKAVATLTKRVYILETAKVTLSGQLSTNANTIGALQAQVATLNANAAAQSDGLKKLQGHKHCVPAIGGFQMVSTGQGSILAKALTMGIKPASGLNATTAPLDGSSSC
jgi:hypothetical protein